MLIRVDLHDCKHYNVPSLASVCSAGHCSGDNAFGAPRIQHHSADSKQDIQARLKSFWCCCAAIWVSPCVQIVISLRLLQQHDDLQIHCREEGVRAFWRGNGTNVIRIFPYSAVQFSTNDACKRIMASKVSPFTLILSLCNDPFLPCIPCSGAYFGVMAASFC